MTEEAEGISKKVDDGQVGTNKDGMALKELDRILKEQAKAAEQILAGSPERFVNADPQGSDVAAYWKGYRDAILKAQEELTRCVIWERQTRV